MSLPAGTRLGPYEIIALIDAGGMGEVYQARDTRLDRMVAIKTLPRGLSADADRRARFEREAKTIAGLNHPHICILHDVGSTSSPELASGQTTLYLVMELLAGETLAHRLLKGPLPLDQALSVATEIADALAAAHRQGFIHRDLKPGNIMLTKTGAKLLDFGLAKLKGDGPEPGAGHLASTSTGLAPLTAEGMIVGTLQYMAPEQMEGKPADARTDLWALGAILYEMLTGKRAFGGAEPPSISQVPPSLDRLISRCLEKDPDDRWQSAQDVVLGLTLIRESVSTSPVTPHSASRRMWLRLALLAGGGVIVAATMFYVRSPPPLPIVVLMDSPLPERVYDPETRQKGGTNSDDITDALAGVPLELHKETTSEAWHRDEQISLQHPALVVMHLSSFAEPGAGHAPDAAWNRTQEFMGLIGRSNPQTQFIIYTRSTQAEADAWLSKTVSRYSWLKGRAHMLSVPGGIADATFRDPKTAALVRDLVISVLGLPNG